MAGLDVDTSSYPKPQAVQPPNALDTIGKMIDIQRGGQALQSGQLGIDKQKLDLVNNRFGSMVKDFTGLINDKDLSEDKIRKRIETDVKLGIVTPDMAGTFIGQLPPTQGMKPDQAKAALSGHLSNWLQHAMTIKEAVDYHMGQPGTVDTGNAIQPVSVSQKPGVGLRSTGLPIQKQIPTGTSGYDQEGNPAFAPPNPNAVAAPPPAPGAGQPTPPSAPPLPVARPVAAGPGEAPNFAQRFAPAVPVLFAEGKEAYTKDQQQALGRATAMKPAEQALKLIPGLRTGPTTETFTKAVAALKANGLIPTEENDPTAIRQIVNKKLAQYVQSSPVGQRSDAAQTLTQESSPNASVQINPALEKLTKDALAMDRLSVARPNAFEGKNYQDYVKHQGTFAQSMDERAFGLGDMKTEERQALVKKMLAKFKANPNDQEAQRFLKSYDVAKKQNFVGNNSEE